MKSNYKKLGEYIALVNERNHDLRYGENDVRGVSNNKEIIQTKANNKGRNFGNFYIVAPNEFIYNSRTSRMGEKVGLGYNDSRKTFITSFNNTVFRIKNEQLLPAYLFMWFNRPEFDRYARYHSWGSSTELFPWDDMCNIELPVPDIENQQEIVKEYQTVLDRIRLNERLNEKLEEAAQAIYRQWFVDFEFPMTAECAESIGKPDLAGQPYKFSGGEMEHNEILEQEIPKGWTNGAVHDLGAVVGGATPSTEEPEYWADGGISWISPKDLSRTGYKFIEHGEKHITEEGFKASSTVMLPAGSVLFSSRAPIGLLAINVGEVCTNQGFKSVIPKPEYGSAYVYFYLQNDTQNICNQGSGSTFNEVSGKVLKEHVCIIPRSTVCSEFSSVCKGLFQFQRELEMEHWLSNQLLVLLHSSLAKDRAK